MMDSLEVLDPKTPLSPAILAKFIAAMESVYGHFTELTIDAGKTWSPPAMAEGHQGRYLWTDGFAVVNFLTLFKATSDERYLTLAKRLVTAVHDILGRTRNGRSRLPGATEALPLNGGLRIGKLDETGSDGDGQYFHYLTVWMFALDRMSLVTGDSWYNQQAVSMAKVVLPRFMDDIENLRPRMFWKLSMDLSRPLVRSEGNLDPIDGYVIYNLLQNTAARFNPEERDALKYEIAALKRIVDTKWPKYSSTDPLDLGMTMWTVYWLCTGEQKEEWAVRMLQRSVLCLKTLIANGYFERSMDRRLAFREFGTSLGIKSIQSLSTEVDIDLGSLQQLPQMINSAWEDEAQLVPVPSERQAGRMEELMPITAVMYATALVPGEMVK